MNLQGVSHIRIPDGDVRMIHDSDNRLLWGAVGYDVQLDGDTFQQTYTGKNLFNKNDTGILDDVRVSTSNGKTYGAVGNHVSYFIKVEPSTTYVLTTGRTAYYAWYSAPSEDSYISGSGWGDEYYFTSPADAQYIRFDFADGNIVQFVEGTSVGDYEPYVGGQPSPNPDYPQQIQTVTGEQTVVVTGKNLFNPSSYTTVHRYPRDDMSIADNQNAWSIVIPIKGDTTYTISTTNRGLMDKYAAVGITTEDPATATGIVAYASMAGGATSATVTSPANGKYMMIYVKWSNTDVTQAIADTLQLEIGSEATEFEPFISKSYEINLNCNIYDRNLAYMSGNDMQIPIDITPGSSYHYGATTRWVGAYLYDASGTLIRTIGHTATTRSGNFTAASNEVKAVFTFYAGPDVTWSWSNVEFYDLAGVIELCKLGTYQDYIWKDGNDWKVHKATATTTLDGSENWSKSGTNTFYVANIYSKIGNSIQSTSTGEMYASHFTIVDISSSNTLVGASLKVDAAQNLSNLRIRLQDMSGGTAGFRQMLSDKKPSIYARRLTPTDTTITDTNLIAQLEAIYNLVRRYGYNFVVSASGNNLPIIIDRTLL